MANKLYKGQFNYYGETHTLHTHSSSSSGAAYYNFINQLAKELNVSKTILMFIFDGSKDNYHIEEVKKNESSNNNLSLQPFCR